MGDFVPEFDWRNPDYTPIFEARAESALPAPVVPEAARYRVALELGSCCQAELCLLGVADDEPLAGGLEYLVRPQDRACGSTLVNER